MRHIFTTLRTGQFRAKDMKVATNRLVAGIVLSNLDGDGQSHADFNERLEIAEDLLTALGLQDEFHLSIWAEHRRKRAALHARDVDKAPLKKAPHAKRQETKTKKGLRRKESY